MKVGTPAREFLDFVANARAGICPIRAAQSCSDSPVRSAVQLCLQRARHASTETPATADQERQHAAGFSFFRRGYEIVKAEWQAVHTPESWIS